ncbi:MAG: lysine-2,3-aminomutase-like protein [Alphaproteobacteria bacterium]|nr:lysine-2,3-aminomutase-like protein [Alphaproteobacteria bacterium]MBU0859903.1 lysine-2,3-aminomutase-like protein [Alphaproteobacteria bacterium]
MTVSTQLKTTNPAPIADDEQSAQHDVVARTYPVRITPHVQDLIDKYGPDSAVGRQYVADTRELSITPDENADPTGDHPHTPVPGIVHRHPDRVLLKPLHACAVYCRFCFRRDMVGPGKDVLDEDALDKAIAYIQNDLNIWEVILTGGDPLVLSPRRLSAMLDSIEKIEHVQVIRIHSRVPVADPERVTDELSKSLDRSKPLYVIVHINHADEITPAVVTAWEKLRRANCTLLSQSVLLRGVNDDVDVLENLFRRLTALRVKPYYLHHPDRAPGTAHFRLPFSTGQRLMNELRGRLSGLCLPTYVLDIPGGAGKVPVGPSYMKTDEDGQIHICDTEGVWYAYPSVDGQ